MVEIRLPASAFSNMRHCDIKLFLIIISLMILGGGCTSFLQQVGEKHKTAAQKWIAMGMYVSSDLPKYGHTITADILFDFSTSTPRFELSNIKFDVNEQTTTIDLLRPSFDSKYLCEARKCILLNEYIKTNLKNNEKAIENIEEGSFLAKQLQKYEFELFDFYAALFILNDNLEILAATNPKALHDYLYYLDEQKYEAQTFKAFSDYASEVLTVEAFESFLNDPIAQYKSEYLQKYIGDQSFVQNDFSAIQPDTNWQGTEAKLDVSNNSDGISNQPVITGDELLVSNSLTIKIPESMIWEKPTLVMLTSSYWNDVQEYPLAVGDSACSYDQNYFGRVQAIQGLSVSLFVRGQAKKVTNGILQDLEEGSLFKNELKVLFLPMASELELIRGDIAPCAIQ